MREFEDGIPPGQLDFTAAKAADEQGLGLPGPESDMRVGIDRLRCGLHRLEQRQDFAANLLRQRGTLRIGIAHLR